MAMEGRALPALPPLLIREVVFEHIVSDFPKDCEEENEKNTPWRNLMKLAVVKATLALY
jgi:hypothetical protein